MRFGFDRFTNLFSRDYFGYVKVLLVIVIAILATVSYGSNFVTSHERLALDWRLRIRGPQFVNPKIVLIEIDHKSVDRLGRPPFAEGVYAKAVRALSSFGAKTIAFQGVFDKEPPPPSDFAAAALDAGNVYLAVDVRKEVKEVKRSFDLLRSSSKGEGHRMLEADPDAVLRSVPFQIELGGGAYLPLGVVVALEMYDTGPSAIVRKQHGFDVSLPNNPPIHAPLQGNRFVLDWPGRWTKSFKRVPLVDLLSAYDETQRGENPRLDTTVFRGSACLVGVTIAGLHEAYATPLESGYPALGAQAVVLNSMLERRFLRFASDQVNLIILWILCVLIFMIVFTSGFAQSVIRILIIAFVYTGVTLGLFLWGDFVLPLVYPLLVLATAFIVLTAFHQIISSFEQHRLLKLVTKDSLTGIFNYRHFRLLLDSEVKETEIRKDKHISLLMVDIDHFKRINDTHGHSAGDEVIRTLAEILRNNCRSLDVACRYGGEEFMLMLPGATIEDAGRIAERIRKSFSDIVFNLGERKEPVRVTVSIGLASYFAKENVEQFVRRADRALYKAKEAGRNMICRA